MHLRSRPLIVGLAVAVVLAGAGAAFATVQHGNGNSDSAAASAGAGLGDSAFAASSSGPRADRDGDGPREIIGTTAAKYLGLSTDQLWTQLRSGKSLADIAKAQGKSVDGLEQALIDALESDLQARVDAGQITKQQQASMLAFARQHVGELVQRGLPDRHEGFRDGDGDGPHGLGLDRIPGSAAVAKYLGLSTDQVRNRLAQGQSLAEIAKAQGKSVDGLKQALVAGAKEDLDKAVAAGTITAQQREMILSMLNARVDELVNRSCPGGMDGRGDDDGDGPGFRGPPGPQGSDGADAAFT